MGTSNRINVVSIVLVASLAVCSWMSVAATAASNKNGASHVEAINGSKLMRVTLTQKAAQRLDIKTAKVEVDGAGIISAPYAAVIYDTIGKTWVYTNPRELVYVRHVVVVESIKGDRAFLKEGPPVGTAVVVIGASELYGVENGVGH